MPSLNKAILMGNFTADPELKQTSNGIAVTSFTIAVSRKFSKDKDDKTDFINCVAWRETANFITKYFHKGSPIAVVGSIQTRTWKDAKGEKRYATEVVVDEANFVESKSSNTEANSKDSKSTGKYMPEAYGLKPSAKFEEADDDDNLPF